MSTVVPSFPAPSFDALLKLATYLRGYSSELQVDIVDGVFVPAQSWPFTDEEPVIALNKLSELSTDFQIELDCMVQQPEQYLDVITALALPRIIIHWGSTEAYEKIIEHARTQGCQIGLAFTSDAPMAAVQPYIDQFDFVQVMGIKNVGSQGQPFDERTYDTVAQLRSHYPDLQIAVDGGVNATTMPRLKTAGVTRFAPGSAITQADDPQTAYQELVALVS